jgi:hypothetical protein
MEGGIETAQGGRLPVLPPSPMTLVYGDGATAVVELPTVLPGGSAYFESPRP